MTHELAHFWDIKRDYQLSGGMSGWVQNGEPPSEDIRPNEQFAYTVQYYFHPDMDKYLCDEKGNCYAWTDDQGLGYSYYTGEKDPPQNILLPGGWPSPSNVWLRDRYDYLGTLEPPFPVSLNSRKHPRRIR